MFMHFSQTQQKAFVNRRNGNVGDDDIRNKKGPQVIQCQLGLSNGQSWRYEAVTNLYHKAEFDVRSVTIA